MLHSAPRDAGRDRFGHEVPSASWPVRRRFRRPLLHQPRDPRDASRPVSWPSNSPLGSRSWRSSPSGRPSSGCGATASTRCAHTSRASGGARPCVHRTLLAIRRRGPRPVLRSRHDPAQACAEGRIGVNGVDLRPFALLTASKVDPRRRRLRLARLAALRLAWNADSAGWLSLAERVLLRPAHPASWVPTAGSGRGPSDHDESVPDEVALAFHQRTLAQLCSCAARCVSPNRPTGSSPRR